MNERARSKDVPLFKRSRLKQPISMNEGMRTDPEQLAMSNETPDPDRSVFV